MEKEFTIGNVLSESWKQFTENFRWIMILGLILFVPISILLSLFYPQLDPLSLADNVGHLNFFFVLKFSEFIFGVVAMMTIACVIKNKIEGKLINLSNIFKKVFLRFGYLILTNLMCVLFLAILTALLIIPGIIYYIYWIFVVLVVLFTDKSGKSALDYSKSLVKGRWWKVLGCILLLSFLVGIPGVFLQMFVTSYLPQMLSNFFLNVVITVVVAFISTFWIVAFTVLYLTLESSKKN